jgi:hypothetical protein
MRVDAEPIIERAIAGQGGEERDRADNNRGNAPTEGQFRKDSHTKRRQCDKPAEYAIGTSNICGHILCLLPLLGSGAKTMLPHQTRQDQRPWQAGETPDYSSDGNHE